MECIARCDYKSILVSARATISLTLLNLVTMVKRARWIVRSLNTYPCLLAFPVRLEITLAGHALVVIAVETLEGCLLRGLTRTMGK